MNAIPTRPALALALLVLGACPAHAEQDGGLWFTALGVLPLNEDFSASLALQPRFDRDVDRYERLVVRPWITRRLDGGHTATLGYDAHVIEAPRDRVEHRAWQQWGWRLPVTANLRTRLRLEERFVENVDGTGVRLRVMAIWRRALGDSGWTFEINDEIFFGLNDVAGGPRDGYDQNRFYAGFSRRLGPRLTGGVGYQMQHIDRPGDDLTLHQAFLTVTVR